MSTLLKPHITRFIIPILCVILAMFLTCVLIISFNGCSKQSATPEQIIYCKITKLPGIIESSQNADGSMVYQFNKLTYDGITYTGGIITCYNASVKVWLNKQTVFWAESDGASITVRCYDQSGHVVQLEILCPYECGHCDTVPPPCSNSITVSN